jgi:hypothetical protein
VCNSHGGLTLPSIKLEFRVREAVTDVTRQCSITNFVVALTA